MSSPSHISTSAGVHASQLSTILPSVQLVTQVAAHTHTPQLVSEETKSSSTSPSQSLSNPSHISASAGVHATAPHTAKSPVSSHTSTQLAAHTPNQTLHGVHNPIGSTATSASQLPSHRIVHVSVAPHTFASPVHVVPKSASHTTLVTCVPVFTTVPDSTSALTHAVFI